MQKKIEKNFFVFEIIASELGALNCLRQRTRQMVRNTVPIRVAARLHYLLITVKLIALERLFFSDTQNPKAVFITLSMKVDIIYQSMTNIISLIETI